MLEASQVCRINHGHSVRGRSLCTHGESVSVRKLIIIGVVVLLGVLFVQPIRAYRAAQSELTTAREQLDNARAIKERAVKAEQREKVLKDDLARAASAGVARPPAQKIGTGKRPVSASS